ncbi:hypothetical protein ACLOJK_041050 [Asimina triloba]
MEKMRWTVDLLAVAASSGGRGVGVMGCRWRCWLASEKKASLIVAAASWIWAVDLVRWLADGGATARLLSSAAAGRKRGGGWRRLPGGEMGQRGVVRWSGSGEDTVACDCCCGQVDGRGESIVQLKTLMVGCSPSDGRKWRRTAGDGEDGVRTVVGGVGSAVAVELGTLPWLDDEAAVGYGCRGRWR